jgi:ABC-2 type transport system ATP-binding protein
MADILRVEGLTKRYGAFEAVADLSFAVAEREVLGLLGRNGAGKSTTIKLLCNLIRPTAGQAWLAGQPILGVRGAEHRRGLGAMVEAPRFYPQLSGRRNLELLARIRGVDGARVQEMLETVGLAARARERFDRYSMGMKQRLGLAAVFLHRPGLIILDEPTSGLDPVGRQQIHDLIRALSRDLGVSLLVCSHHFSEVETLCGRALVLDHGRRVLDQSLAGPEGIAAVKAKFQELTAELNERRESA